MICSIAQVYDQLLPKAFDFAFLLSYHLYRLLWSLVWIKVAYLHHVILLSQKLDHRKN
jgi:hypothetical protein